MKNRFLAMSTVLLIASVSPAPAAGQSLPPTVKSVDKARSTLRTADGQPDINGIWTTMT
jgi:hypothetical protein